MPSSQQALHYRPAQELVQELSNGTLTSEAVTQHFLDQIRHHNDTINAVVTLDEQRALSRA